jgi:hypothetical protein
MIKVEGLWSKAEAVVIVTRNSLNFVRPDYKRPVSLVGEGEHSVLHWAGKIDGKMFGI